jgi:hypothetical protein
MSRKTAFGFVPLLFVFLACGMASLYVGQPDELKIQRHAMVVKADGTGSVLVSYADWDGTLYVEQVADEGGVFRIGDAFSVQYKTQEGGNSFQPLLLCLCGLFLVCAIIGVIIFFID